MPPVMNSFSHRIELQDGRRTYEASTSYLKGIDVFEVRSNQGAICSLRHTPSSLAIDGRDEKGRRFTLKLIADGSDIQAELDVAGQSFRASGSKKSVMSELNSQVGQRRGIKSQLPSSTSLPPLAKRMKDSAEMVALMVGHSAPRLRRKSYCQAICDCCSQGSWMSAWCCISCASCDFFEVSLADKFQVLTKFDG